MLNLAESGIQRTGDRTGFTVFFVALLSADFNALAIPAVAKAATQSANATPSANQTKDAAGATIYFSLPHSTPEKVVLENSDTQ